MEEAARWLHKNGGQSQSGKSRQDEEIDDVTTEANPEVAERHAEITEDVDDLLDEIDSVLEENAEEFVRGLRAKGRPVSRARTRHSPTVDTSFGSPVHGGSDSVLNCNGGLGQFRDDEAGAITS